MSDGSLAGYDSVEKILEVDGSRHAQLERLLRMLALPMGWQQQLGRSQL